MKGRALVLIALSSCLSHASIFSTFDSGNEGWSAVDVNFPSLAVVEAHAAGWSSGHLSETEANFSHSGLFVLAAPAAYLGDLSAYYGAVASFKLSDTHADPTVYPSLLLRGNGIALGYVGTQTPSPAGTDFTVPLSETGWVTLGGVAATPAQFQSVLSNVDVFAINADWTLAGTDVVTLDNVAVLSPVPEPATWAVLGLGVAGVMRRRKGQRPISK